MGEHPHVVGRYTLQEPLGQGYLGALYRALAPSGGHSVALMLLDPALTPDPATRAQLVREIERLAAIVLHQPGIAELYDTGEADGSVWFAMTLVSGATLWDTLREQGRLALPRAVELVEQIAEALAVLHARGVVWADANPLANALVTPEGRAVLPYPWLRWALSRTLGEGRRSIAPPAADPLWLAPEQLATPSEATPQSDVYQLGAMAFTLLTGDPPGLQGDAAEVLRAKLHGPRPDLPTGVAEVLAAALAADPAHRPRGTRALAASLRLWSPR